jgi:hypothetical protein
LVFLHRFGPQSYIYTLNDRGGFAVFVDPAILVLTPEGMGANWVVLCQDEVYVQDRIAPEHLIGVAVHSADAESVRSDLMSDFQRLGIPLYDFDGNVLWRPARAENCTSAGSGTSNCGTITAIRSSRSATSTPSPPAWTD